MYEISQIILFVISAVACSPWKKDSDTVVNTPQSNESVSHKPIYVVKNPKASKPFNTMEYDRVVAYDYGQEGEHGYLQIVDKEGNLDATVKQHKDLTQEQVNEITMYLGENETYGESSAYCFEPHLGLVFYKGNKITAHVSICLACNLLRSSVDIPATHSVFINKDAENEIPLEGFSKTGKAKLQTLCEKLQFSYCK